MKDNVNEEHQNKEDFKEMKMSKLEHLGILDKTIADKGKRAGDLRLSLAQDHDALLDSETELENSQVYLKNLSSECASKAKMRDMRAKMSANEILAVGEAIAILTEDTARETLTSALPPALTQMMQPTTGQDYEAFVQVAQSVQKVAAPHRPLLAQEKRSFLQKPDAEEFAGQAEKVVHFMINNMVEVLHNDDVNDEHKKEFCANETESFYQLEQEKIHLQEQLTATIEKNTGELKMVVADIKALEEQIYTLDKEVSLATALRKKEHTEFVNTFATMETARRLIDKAANKLQSFYNPKQAEMNAAGKFDTLLQTSGGRVAPPEMVETPGEYEKSPGGNKIIGMMNEIKADMTRDMREMEVDEKYSAKDYVRQMKDGVEDRAAAVKMLHEKQSTKAKLEEKIMQDKEMRILTLKELEEINLYQIELHAECDFLLRNFDNRHGARVSEEVGLEGAETIVTHETPPTATDTAKVFDTEESKKQVDQHFPDAEMPH